VLRLDHIFMRISALAAALLLVVGVAIPIIVPAQAGAAGLITSRKLNISSSANGTISTDANGDAVPPGAGGNGLKAKHTVTFTMDTNNATIGSITIMYCTSPIIQNSCTTPTGLDASHITSVTVTGYTGGNPSFALDTTTANASLSPSANGVCNGSSSTTRENCVAMARTSNAAETGKPSFTITYGGGGSNYITNPTVDNYSFYARILVFSSITFTGIVDYGGTAAATAQQIDIMAKVQEILNFSVGTTPTLRVGTACTPFNDTGEMVLGDTNSVLSTLQAFDNHSYFRINTNTVNGTAVYYSGDTLTSGAFNIDPMPSQSGPVGTASSPGSEQFGLAIDSDDVDPGSNIGAGYSFTDLSSTAPYAHGQGAINAGPFDAKFVFKTSSQTAPEQIASSSAGISCDTGSVRYVANVSTSTPAGIYRTTITFIALGTY
jgi:hypothetical protein